ncbi:MAG: NAD(P)/FAD-dependent oxidoreductase [Pseudomonadales bacterium]
MTKVAIIGSGIAGLTTAYLLRRQYDVSLFEANDYLGGHTHTHEIEVDEQPVTVDTGFIVYNDRTYPNFMRLLSELGCSGLPSEMSFSLRDEAANFEYNGHNLDTLFAQRSNCLNPKFWIMIRDILRFNKMAKQLEYAGSQSLDEFMATNGFSETFKSRYLYPMAAAIWSTGDQAIGEFPVRSLVDFFVNHGLVDLKNRPQWYVVEGGSNQYVKQIAPLLKDVRLNTPVRQVRRVDNHVNVSTAHGIEDFDQVVFACHSDQALKLLQDPTPAEQNTLGAMKYTPNTAYLHTDRSRLPQREKAWASWNYAIPRNKAADQARLTYNMNILQHIQTPTQVLVTLNDPDIPAEHVIAEFDYAHPFYDQAMLDAQGRHSEISGHSNTHYCGAYWYYGFHEDGVKSALRVCEALGVTW